MEPAETAALPTPTTPKTPKSVDVLSSEEESDLDEEPQEMDTGATPTRSRLVLFAVWFCCSCVELYCWMIGITEWWTVFLFLCCSIWCWLDAALRFPVCHGIDSFFVWKNLLVTGNKMWLVAIGTHDFTENWPFFIALYSMNLLLPVLYVMLLPLELSPLQQRLYAHAVVDEDIIVRLARVMKNPGATWEYLRDQQWLLYYSVKRHTFSWVRNSRSSIIAKAVCSVDARAKVHVRRESRSA